MALPRMTTRRWLIAVVVVAIVLEVARLMWLSAEYRLRALEHATIRLDMKLPMDAKTLNWVQRFHAYHQAMREKWERAARFPWLPVAPDPPEPQ